MDIKIFVSAGELLRDLPRTRGELSQIQEKDLLQSVETNFFSITGIHCIVLHENLEVMYKNMLTK